MPFITIVRQPNPQVGNNQSGLYNIPGRNNYTYYKVPTFEGGRKGIDVYKVPQPTSVDITYEVRIFSNKLRDLNKFNTKVLKAFNSIQYYIRVKGHPKQRSCWLSTDLNTLLYIYLVVIPQFTYIKTFFRDKFSAFNPHWFRNIFILLKKCCYLG